MHKYFLWKCCVAKSWSLCQVPTIHSGFDILLIIASNSFYETHFVCTLSDAAAQLRISACLMSQSTADMSGCGVHWLIFKCSAPSCDWLWLYSVADFWSLVYIVLFRHQNLSIDSGWWHHFTTSVWSTSNRTKQKSPSPCFRKAKMNLVDSHGFQIHLAPSKRACLESGATWLMWSWQICSSGVMLCCCVNNDQNFRGNLLVPCSICRRQT